MAFARSASTSRAEAEGADSGADTAGGSTRSIERLRAGTGGVSITTRWTGGVGSATGAATAADSTGSLRASSGASFGTIPAGMAKPGISTPRTTRNSSLSGGAIAPDGISTGRAAGGVGRGGIEKGGISGIGRAKACGDGSASGDVARAEPLNADARMRTARLTPPVLPSRDSVEAPPGTNLSRLMLRSLPARTSAPVRTVLARPFNIVVP